MSTLRFWRPVTPTPGPVALRFGHYRPVVTLRFERPVAPTPGPVVLRFGPYQPPAQPDIVTAALTAALPPAQVPPLALAATAEVYAPAVIITGSLAATLAPPALPLDLAAAARLAVHATAAAALPPAQPGLALAAIGDVYDPHAPADATLAAALPAPALPLDLAASAVIGVNAAAAATLPPAALTLACAAAAQYDSRTDRPLAARSVARHQQAAALTVAALQRQQQARPQPTAVRARHQQAARSARPVRAVHQQAAPITASRAARHHDARPLRHHIGARHQDAQRLRPGLAAHHHDATPVRAHRAARSEDALRLRRAATARHQDAAPVARTAAHPLRAALPTGHWTRPRHQDAMRPPPGRYTFTPPAPIPESPYSSPVTLRFCVLADGTTVLRFGACKPRPSEPGAGIVVPILGAYIVLNTVTLVRADTGEPIEIEQFTASIDADSWTWGWSATLHADLMPLVRSPGIGQHVELIATINGTPLRLVVERMGRDRRFADRRLKISGRGRAAWLADPHSPIETRYNTQQRTAQQLLADALTINGVPLGWSIDWRITDWQVPAGAWSHTGTYIDAALRISEAGGAYVQAHNTDQTLIIAPRYPAAPWDWPGETPDIELPEDVVEVEGIEWHDKPAYNAVWIAGEQPPERGGRRDRIRRTGSAADRYAQSIVDPLATAPEMTRQRGLAILGDTGRQAHISLRLPVLPETGIIQPGKLVRYTESGAPRLGLTRAVSIDHRFPELWQTIRLETHEIEPV